jgi:membrane protein DedA with SNARE-associated domain
MFATTTTQSLNSLLDFLLHHGYVVLLGWVFAEQVGIPIPTMPLLLAAGALAGTGHLNFFACLFICVFAAVCADSIWYELGRLKGIKVLQLLCRISLEPDSCVRRTQGMYAKNGARSLLVAKFVPGLGTIAPPLAGIFQMVPGRFLIFDACGALLWAGAYLTTGYLFSSQIGSILDRAPALGGKLILILVMFLGAYVGYKFVARQRFLRQLRIGRITAEELKEKLDSGEELVIVDLRHSLDFEADPETIPGAFRMDAIELEEKNDRLPPDREVILYCT